MSTNENLNLTYLFNGNNGFGRKSESFWTGFLAMAIACSCRTGGRLELPVYNYRPGGFVETSPPFVACGVSLADILIEAPVRPGFVPDFNVVPKDLFDLKPDIVVKQDRVVSILEVKTVGNPLKKHQKDNYERLNRLLRECGYDAKIYYVLSAGHEVQPDWGLLGQEIDGEMPKLILWEKIFSTLDGQVPPLDIFETLGSTKRYFENDSYMRW